MANDFLLKNMVYHSDPEYRFGKFDKKSDAFIMLSGIKCGNTFVSNKVIFYRYKELCRSFYYIRKVPKKALLRYLKLHFDYTRTDIDRGFMLDPLTIDTSEKYYWRAVKYAER